MPSSVIRAMRFDPVRRVLEIAFRGVRGVYRYFDVPMEEWRRFRGAPAKGAYLNGIFKGLGHRFEKVPVSLVASDDQQRHAEEDNQGEPQAELLQWGESGAFPEPCTQGCDADDGEGNEFEDLAA